MTEEDVPKDEVKEGEASESELTKTEQEAYDRGWIPEVEWKAKEENEGRRHRSAEEYLDRGELFEKIDSQKGYIGKLEGDVRHISARVDSMANSYESVQRIAKEKAIKELKREHAEAIKEENHERAGEILDEIQEEAKEPEKAAPPPAQPNPDYVEWVEQNTWYLNDPILQAAVDSFAKQTFQNGATFPSTKAMYATFTDHAKRLYPEKFEAPKAPRTPPKVEGTKRSDSVRTKKVTRSDIPEDYRGEFDRQVARGMTPEAVVDGWKSVGMEI